MKNWKRLNLAKERLSRPFSGYGPEENFKIFEKLRRNFKEILKTFSKISKPSWGNVDISGFEIFSQNALKRRNLGKRPSLRYRGRNFVFYFILETNKRLGPLLPGWRRAAAAGRILRTVEIPTEPKHRPAVIWPKWDAILVARTTATSSATAPAPNEIIVKLRNARAERRSRETEARAAINEENVGYILGAQLDTRSRMLQQGRRRWRVRQDRVVRTVRYDAAETRRWRLYAVLPPSIFRSLGDYLLIRDLPFSLFLVCCARLSIWIGSRERRPIITPARIPSGTRPKTYRLSKN